MSGCSRSAQCELVGTDDGGLVDEYPSCNPAGTEIAWARETGYKSGTTQIFKISVSDFLEDPFDPSDIVQLTFPIHNNNATMPTWSPSGSQIAFATNRYQHNDPTDLDYDIWVINSTGTANDTPLTDNSDEDDEPNWGPGILE